MLELVRFNKIKTEEGPVVLHTFVNLKWEHQFSSGLKSEMTQYNTQVINTYWQVERAFLPPLLLRLYAHVGCQIEQMQQERAH